MIRKQFLFKSVSKTDKSIIITAGLHGDEQTSVYAVDELIYALQTKKFIPVGIKKIIIYNYINLDGILMRERLCRNIDLNRDFSEIQSSNKNIQQIKLDIQKSDIAIDVHSSFNSTEFFFIDEDKYANSYINFLTKYNLPYVISPALNKNTLKFYISNKYIEKSGFTLELNQNGANIDITSALRGVNILKIFLNNISKLIKKSSNLPDKKYKSITLTADITGLLKINDILNKKVNRGDKLGYILSLDKSRMINIIAPCTGKVIVYPSAMSYISVNSPILSIQPIKQ